MTFIEPSEMEVLILIGNVKKTDSLASASLLTILQTVPCLTRRYFTNKPLAEPEFC